MTYDPIIRTDRVKFGDRVRLYGLPGTFEVWATTVSVYDFHAKPIERPELAGFPALASNVVEINGQPVPLLSCPIAPPADDYPHLPQFDYIGPKQNAFAAVDVWQRGK